MKIRQKVLLSPAVALAALLMLLVFAGLTLQSQQETTAAIVGQRNLTLQNANTVLQDIGQAHAEAYRFMFIMGKVDDKVQARALDKLGSLQAQARRSVKAAAESEALNSAGQAQATRVAQEIEGYLKKVKSALDMADVDMASASQIMQAADDEFRKVHDDVQAWIGSEKAQVQDAMAASQQAYERSLVIGLGLTALALAACVAISLLMARRITAPLQAALGVANRLAQGEIVPVTRVAEEDESSALLNALAGTSDNLRVLVSRIREVASEVSLSSSEIAQGNINLAQRTEATASALQQTAATVQQFSDGVSQAAQGAIQASQRAHTAREAAEESRTEVSRIVDSMAAILASSKKIGEITSVIDGIAFQTNILALNAAVEAARAGEQGRGFAVVAAEVRSLAQRSAVAAKDISNLIRQAGSDVDQGSALVTSVGERTETLVNDIRELAAAVTAIASSADEQSVGIREVNRAVASIESNTQQNAALVEQISANSRGLQDQTELLVQTVGAFRTAGDARNTPLLMQA
ncbi:methyl-accepting chemotaxis protein [Curvibacter sp. HBC61]|uniref:Methyl-accepting chemotaxis protein n=1 Tax=Curvibacter cyanobacteriorum TaxID=3026422 RepID=A0ABT5N371_9BURK|nr:methyl-accepting chemotaxis protein [Curvibacter sp. HBC61]MDD0840764.1 methyl-accepting chemotaxis protein [Curvibacter sp. HBC61]